MLDGLPDGSRILDAGAGTQKYRKLCGHLNYVSKDFAQYDGIGDLKGLHWAEFNYWDLDIVSDITCIPEKDASFDAIICIEVFEHLPDPIKAVQEFSRLLRPGGSLILSAPYCSLTHLAPFHFYSGFNRYWYQRHLTDFGFEISELKPNGNFFQFMAQELHRTPSVNEQFSSLKINFLEQFFLFMTMRMFLKQGRHDNGSSDLLCFGYHVHAHKKLPTC